MSYEDWLKANGLKDTQISRNRYNQQRNVGTGSGAGPGAPMPTVLPPKLPENNKVGTNADISPAGPNETRTGSPTSQVADQPHNRVLQGSSTGHVGEITMKPPAVDARASDKNNETDKTPAPATTIKQSEPPSSSPSEDVQTPAIPETETPKEKGKSSEWWGNNKGKIGNIVMALGGMAEAFAHGATGGKYGQTFNNTMAGQQYSANQEQARKQEDITYLNDAETKKRYDQLDVREKEKVKDLEKQLKILEESGKVNRETANELISAQINGDIDKIKRIMEMKVSLPGALKLALINNPSGTLSAGSSLIGNALGALFDSGGYTGEGDKHTPNGVVHAGEYVVPKEGVNQVTGMPRFSYLKFLADPTVDEAFKTGTPDKYYKQWVTRKKLAELKRHYQNSPNYKYVKDIPLEKKWERLRKWLSAAKARRG